MRSACWPTTLIRWPDRWKSVWVPSSKLRPRRGARGRQLLERAVAEYLAFVQHVAQGDLTQRLPVSQNGALGQLGEGLNNMVVSLHTITSQVQHANANIATAAAEILAATTQQAASAAE